MAYYEIIRTYPSPSTYFLRFSSLSLFLFSRFSISHSSAAYLFEKGTLQNLIMHEIQRAGKFMIHGLNVGQVFVIEKVEVGFEISLRDFKIDETNSTLLETILLGKDCLWSSECMEKLKKHLQFEETVV